MNGKPSSPVLRGLGASNGARLLDNLKSIYEYGVYQNLGSGFGSVASEMTRVFADIFRASNAPKETGSLAAASSTQSPFGSP
jgi:hypothetical protein